MSDGELILVVGALLAGGIAISLLAGRIRLPGLVLVLGLGMLLGSDGLGWLSFDDHRLARSVGVVALALILFEGGLAVGLPEIRPVLGPSIALAVVGTVATAVIAGLTATWLFDLSTKEGMLLGSVLASTDGAATFALLRGSTLRRRVARTLEGEAGLNDPVAVILTVLAVVVAVIARPAATLLATTGFGFSFPERLVLGWAGLRGAVPVVLATFPVIVGVAHAGEFFNVVFFAVLLSATLQGATFEAVAKRLGVTSDAAALPAPLMESGAVSRLGAEVVQFRVAPADAAAGRLVRELELPRDALLNLVVRAGHALPPRGSTGSSPATTSTCSSAKRSRSSSRRCSGAGARGRSGRRCAAAAPCCAATVFTSRPAEPGDGDHAHPTAVNGIAVLEQLHPAGPSRCPRRAGGRPLRLRGPTRRRRLPAAVPGGRPAAAPHRGRRRGAGLVAGDHRGARRPLSAVRTTRCGRTARSRSRASRSR